MDSYIYRHTDRHTGTPGLSRIAKCVRWSHWHLTVEPSWLIRPHPLLFHSPLGNVISDLIGDIIHSIYYW